MNGKQRLELTWIGKNERPRLEPRILLAEDERSHRAEKRMGDADIFDNMLIHGDNLLALKALESEFSGRVKCIYIDPPFNTKQAFEHYDDGVEHSLWLGLMRDRLELLRSLLREDGTLLVHIDDNELGYLIALLDEIFGRPNRQFVVTFKQGAATGHKSINPGCVSVTSFVLIYSKSKSAWSPQKVFTGRERDTRYNQFIRNVEQEPSKWQFVPLTSAFAEAQGVTERDARKMIKENPELLDAFVMENARNISRFARPDFDAVSDAARQTIEQSRSQPSGIFLLKRDAHSDMYFKSGERILFYSDKLKLVDGALVAGEPLTTLWDDLLSNNLHNEGDVSFPKGKKPESLIKRVLDLATLPGDIVLDSFAGSGTTGAVAHKMGRRWIMIEQGEHCHTHIIPRLKKVIDGEDPGGVTEATGWKGGGGFRYFRLAPSLIERDEWGNEIISSKYDGPMLAEAMCKHMGFAYDPSPDHFWLHGRSTERDFIYVTTAALTHEQLKKISDLVGPERTLLVCCRAFQGARVKQLPNLTVVKIPHAILSRCEWGKDDYSMGLSSMETAPAEPEDAAAPAEEPEPPRKRRKKAAPATPSLFDEEDEG